jgi:S1-C subfamily serine protease
MTQPPVPPPYLPPYPPTPALTGPRLRRRVLVLVGVVAIAASGAALSVAFGAGQSRVIAGAGSLQPSRPASDGLPGRSRGYGGQGGYGGPGSTTTASTLATAAQQVGVVDVNTVLGYQQAQAAGTGMVLTASGEVLTNNHVVDGATSISVTVVSTGRTYAASVVGTDPSQDVAVIQLQKANGLQTVALGHSSSVRVGDPVTGVGNAGGTGGTPAAATGSVVALDRTITASDQGGGNTEQLTGVIETDAPIVPGDSGGPLYDSSGRIIGMDTAAGGVGSGASTGYAITIEHALSVASQIESGRASGTVHIGSPGFLGVSVGAGSGGVGGPGGGATVESVVPGGPAAAAGLAPGDVITTVGRSAITSAGSLRDALSTYRPGQSVTIGWTDANGQSQNASVVLTTGPAD